MNNKPTLENSARQKLIIASYIGLPKFMEEIRWVSCIFLSFCPAYGPHNLLFVLCPWSFKFAS